MISNSFYDNDYADINATLARMRLSKERIEMLLTAEQCRMRLESVKKKAAQVAAIKRETESTLKEIETLLVAEIDTRQGRAVRYRFISAGELAHTIDFEVRNELYRLGFKIMDLETTRTILVSF